MKNPAIDVLNNEFLNIYEELESSEMSIPKGKDRLGIKGVIISTNKAQDDEKWMIIHHPELIDIFELVGKSNHIAPALLAGISSRESDLGKLIDNANGYGWGDCKKTQKYGKKIYHNFYRAFSIMQIDIISGPINQKMSADLVSAMVTKEPKFDPYGIEWVQIAAQNLNSMLIEAKRNNPLSTQAIQLATSISYNNSGSKRHKHPIPAYPISDNYTTGGDYANDILVRAKYFAENWNNVVNQAKQYNQFPKK